MKLDLDNAAAIRPSEAMIVGASRRLPFFHAVVVTLSAGALFAISAPAQTTERLALRPPMGWNDWAHYQCDFTADDILANAKALVKTGLASRGYNTVTIDDCWMQKDRDASGNLQVDLKRFPQGMKAVGDAIHGLGLKFGIYEDAGYLTCGGFAGSGEPKGGGKDHFLQDAKLFASWGVDYLKLDGCNVYIPTGGTQDAAYRKAYSAQATALKKVGRPVVFSESAPAYFQGTPGWYDVLNWVGGYGQLWREGTDINVFDAKKPDASRFDSILWNYAYNLPLGRWQKPGNWNDADFIIGGDRGTNLAESRTQLALWAMMSAPLILSSDLEKLDSKTIAILGNEAVLAIDQDPLGESATLVRRTPAIDILIKRLKGGDYAIAISNRINNTAHVDLHPPDLGFSGSDGCRFDLESLWSGNRQSGTSIDADVKGHDTEIWRAHAGSSCGAPTRTGDIILTANEQKHDFGFEGYTRCLSSQGTAGACTGSSSETWVVGGDGSLRSGGSCLAVANGKVIMQPCSASADQHWTWTQAGQLRDGQGQCLTGAGSGLTLQSCGHNLADQIWSLPNH
jgi:alpha-galactosidase